MPIRIAVATDDGKFVKEGPFHEAKYFAIYEVAGRSPTRIELRVNTRRGSRKGPSSVLEILRDCEILVSRSFDVESREIIESRGKITMETNNKELESAVLEAAEKIARL